MSEATLGRNLVFLAVFSVLYTTCLSCTFINREQSKDRLLTKVGCFEDKINSRDLPIPGGHGQHMTPQECNLLCRKEETKYFGLQEGGYCWCGNSFNKYGKKDESDCTDPCTGDATFKCGGKNRNTVYNVNSTG